MAYIGNIKSKTLPELAEDVSDMPGVVSAYETTPNYVPKSTQLAPETANIEQNRSNTYQKQR